MLKKKILIWAYKKTEEILEGNEGLKKFLPIRAFRRRLINYVASHYKSDHVEIGGHNMFLDSKDSLRLSLKGTYGEFEMELVKKEVARGDFVVDLGANIGYWTLVFARLVGDDGRVYAFEPDPENFEILKKNVQHNGYHNVILERKAVSNITGKTQLYLSDEKNDNRIYDPHDNRRSIEIDTVTLDDYFENKNVSIRFIKMNIQGAEAATMQGMEKLIHKSKNLTILTEFTPSFISTAGMESKVFLSELLKNGFHLYEVRPKQKRVRRVSIDELLKRYTVKKENSTYLLCTKKILD